MRAGDPWDFVALGPDSRLVLRVFVGKRLQGNAATRWQDVKPRLAGTPERITRDEGPGYPEVIQEVCGEEYTPPRAGRPGRPAGPRKEIPEGLNYATVRTRRAQGRGVEVLPQVVLGAVAVVLALLGGKKVSTSYLERHNATDRHRNARTARKTYRFSKAFAMHEALTYFTVYSYNFGWPVRTLRKKIGPRRYQPRAPAMVAGLTDHAWSLREWLAFPACQRS